MASGNWKYLPGYLPGYNTQADVLGFGTNTNNAMYWQSMHAKLDVHEGVTCSSCGANPLRGIRWKCSSCPNHEVCGECRKLNRIQDVGHPFQMVNLVT